MSSTASMKLYRQGAEARLYVDRHLGEPIMIKERFPKRYRHPRLDEQLTKERLKGEVRSLMRCQAIGIRTPRVLFADLDSSVIIMEHIECAETSRDFIRRILNSSEGLANPKLNQLAREIGRTCAMLHNNGIIHGDLTTSNMLIERASDGGDNDDLVNLVLIDFGLGFAEGSAEDKGVDLYVLERAFLSTHPNTETIYDIILDSYRSELNKNDKVEVMQKFNEIRARGRKRTMMG